MKTEYIGTYKMSGAEISATGDTREEAITETLRAIRWMKSASSPMPKRGQIKVRETMKESAK